MALSVHAALEYDGSSSLNLTTVCDGIGHQRRPPPL